MAGPPTALRPHPDAENPVLAAGDVADRRGVLFVADPFLVRARGAYHLFFEVKRDASPLPAVVSSRLPGPLGARPRFEIAHATSTDGLAWRYEGVVIPAERAEHTYPCVFAHEGEWYMCPSPAGGTPQEFRLYRADPFPTEWTLVERRDLPVRTDPTPFAHGGRWYLAVQDTDCDVVLYHAESLVGGDWREHPDSPLFAPGENVVSLGGRPVVHEGGVDLFLRRGGPGVVEHWRAETLTPDRIDLRERPTSPILGPGDRRWNARNVHHVDLGCADDGLVAVDGQDRRNRYRIGIYGPT